MYYDYYLYYLSYLESLYTGYPLIVQLTLFMVMVFSLITLFGIVRLCYIGYKINKRDKYRKKTREYFEEKLNFIMRSERNYDLAELHQLIPYEAKHWRSEVVTEVVLNVKNSVSKEGVLNDINYKNIVEGLRLCGFWEKRLRTSAPNVRKEAMQVVGQFDRGINTGVLSKSIFHKNNHLRKTARDLYTSQDNYNPFRFMEDNFDESFSQLDKLRLHSTLIKRSKDGKLPNLLRWISNSKKANYIVFILREVGFFKQYEAAPALVEMLDRYESKDVRAQIASTLGDLNYVEAVDCLIKRYSLESTLVRETIITTMGRLKCSAALNFLIDAYRSKDDMNLKLSIARSIKKHGDEGLLWLKNFQQDAIDQSFENESILLKQVFSERSILSV